MEMNLGLEYSYLTEPDRNGACLYDVDMVVTVSENLLNSQMRLYLDHCGWGIEAYILTKYDDERNCNVEFLLCEKTDESQIPSIFGLEDTVKRLHDMNLSLFKAIQGFNLFDIPSGTIFSGAMQRDILLKQWCVECGVRLAAGFPEEIMPYIINHPEVDPDEVLKVVSLNEKHQSVSYRQFFKKFEVFQLASIENSAQMIFTKVEQNCSVKNPVESLWSITSDVELCFKEISYNEIPQKIKEFAIKKNKAVGPDDAFNISQLMLDLSTLQVATPLSVDGMPGNVKKFVNEVTKTFFKFMEENGQSVFGYVIIPSSSNHINYLFKPQKLDFTICQNELHYLVNFDDNIPSLLNQKKFTWAPILAAEYRGEKIDGAMAVKIFPIIRKIFEDEILLNFDKIQYTMTDPCKFCWKCDRTMRLSYGCDRTDETDFVAVCETLLSETEIDGVKYPACFFNFKFLGKNLRSNGKCVSDKTYYDVSKTSLLVIKMNGYGEIVFDLRDGEWEGNAEELNVVDKYKESAGKFLKECDWCAVNVAHSAFIDRYYFNRVDWFMPGCCAFTFKNEGFSKGGDLVAEINYVQE